MHLTRIKEDVTAISYEILRRNGLSVKFRVKTYSEGLNNTNTYYYKNYMYNIKNNKKYSITLTPRSYIQFDFGIDDGKHLFFLSEVYKNRFVRKLSPLVRLLDDYDNGDIDILSVDSNGTKINPNVPNNFKIKLGVHKALVSIIIREDKMDIGVSISIDEMNAVISMYDFIDLISKISKINYIDLSMQLLNHLGAPDIESNIVDYRPEHIRSSDTRTDEINAVAKTDPLKSLKDLSTKKEYKVLNW